MEIKCKSTEQMCYFNKVLKLQQISTKLQINGYVFKYAEFDDGTILFAHYSG